jgi:Flp pilus assembly protein TadB
VRAAAEAGEGWVYDQLRRALEEGRLRRQEPWVVLGQLGVEFGVAELEELAAAVALAERQGASVRRSLAAKASVIVDQALAEAEARAKSATVRMAGPLVLLGMGFAALFLYGAVMSVFEVIP